jgi:iron complex transport system substrate-binding protein
MRMRIVSLLPSATEILCLLGLEDSLVGVSHECDYPPAALRLPKVVSCAFDPAGLSEREIDEQVRAAMEAGRGACEIDETLLASLRPDLVITQELCDVCAVPQAAAVAAVARLAPSARLLSLHPHALSDVFDDIRRIGEATETSGRARREIERLSGRLARVAERLARIPRRPRVAALEWLDPIMASGHWVVEMIARAGGTDFLGRDRAPSVCVAWEEVARYAPEVVVLMPCGFDVERGARDAGRLAVLPGWESLPAVASGEVYAVDGSAYFNRSGPRLVDGVEILAEILHPEVFPRRERPEDYRRLRAVAA